MRYQSKKQRQLYRKMRAEREAFLAQFSFCMVCHRGDCLYGLAVHEILRGSIRRQAFQKRETWLSACGHCNTHVLDCYQNWPPEKQFATKIYFDPEFFDLTVIHDISVRRYHPEDIAKFGSKPPKYQDLRGIECGCMVPVHCIGKCREGLKSPDGKTYWRCICYSCGKCHTVSLPELKGDPSCPNG